MRDVAEVIEADGYLCSSTFARPRHMQRLLQQRPGAEGERGGAGEVEAEGKVYAGRAGKDMDG
jgi:hypothetical protein